MQIPKYQNGAKVALVWKEIVNGKPVDKCFVMEEASAQKHLIVMKNNPLVKNPKIVREP